MAGVLEVLTGVLSLRAVATGGIAAGHTHPNVDPLAALLEAFRANRIFGIDNGDLVEMGTNTACHRALEYQADEVGPSAQPTHPTLEFGPDRTTSRLLLSAHGLRDRDYRPR